MFKESVMSVHRPQVEKPRDNPGDGKLTGHAGRSSFVQPDSRKVWFIPKQIPP